MTDGFKQFSKVKGGQKHLWLQNHREFVINYYDEFGKTATLAAFKVEEVTLSNLLETPGRQTHNKFSKADRALAQAEITQAGLQQLTAEVKELRQLFENFQGQVGDQLIKKFFLPLIQAGIKVDDSLNSEKKDLLRIDNIDFKQLAEDTRKRFRSAHNQ